MSRTFATDSLFRPTQISERPIIAATIQGSSADSGWYRLCPDGTTATRLSTNELMLDNLRDDITDVDLNDWILILANDGYLQRREIYGASDGAQVTVKPEFRLESDDGTSELGTTDIRYILLPQLLNPLNIAFNDGGEGNLEIGYSTEFLKPGLGGYSREVVSADTGSPTIIQIASLSVGRSIIIPAAAVDNLFYRFTSPSNDNRIFWGEQRLIRRGGTGAATGGTGGGGTVIVSGDFVASLNAADNTPAAQVKITGDSASAMWRFVGADRQHEIVQAGLTFTGTGNSDFFLTMPRNVASGAAGNDWDFILAAGAAPQPAQAAYVDLFGSATQYLRVQLNSAGADGNDWKVIIARTTGATSATASIDTTDEELTITITSTATLAAVKTAIDNTVSGVTTTLFGTNPGTAVVGARTTAQIAGSQTHDTTANTIDFHSGAAATGRESVQFSVDATAMTATVSGVYSDTLITALVTAVNAVWTAASVAAGSGTVTSPSATISFSGGLDIEPLSAAVDDTAMTVTVNYEATVDTLTDIVAIIDAETDVEARLYGGVSGAGLAQATPFSVSFVPESILSEQDVLSLILDEAEATNTNPFDASKIPFDEMPAATLLSILGVTADNINDMFVNVQRTGNRLIFTQRDNSTLTINLPYPRVLPASQVAFASNVYTLSPSPAITAYSGIEQFVFKTTDDNTGAVTLGINTRPALPLYKADNTAIASGELPANRVITITYFEADTAASLPERFVTDLQPITTSSSGTPSMPGTADGVLTGLALSGTTLTATLSTGGPVTVNLASLAGHLTGVRRYVAASNVTGGANIARLTIPNYIPGQIIQYRSKYANTGATTAVINSGTPVVLKRKDGVDLDTGDILVGQLVTLFLIPGTPDQFYTDIGLPASAAHIREALGVTEEEFNNIFTSITYGDGILNFEQVDGTIRSFPLAVSRFVDSVVFDTTIDQLQLTPTNRLFTDLVHGWRFRFNTSENTNSGPVTLKFHTEAAITARKKDNSHFGPGELPTNQLVEATYMSALGSIPARWVIDVDPMNFITQQDLANYRHETPNRGTQLPASLKHREFFVLEADSHASDRVYSFAGEEIEATNDDPPPVNWQYSGIQTLVVNAEYPTFGTSGASTIFRSDRVAGLYQVGSGEPKIVLRSSLLNAASLAAGNTELKLRLPALGDVSVALQPSTFEDTGTATRDVSGVTYAIYEPMGNSGTAHQFEQTIENLGRISFQLSEVVSGSRRYLSDDNSNAWAAATDAVAGLWTGNAAGVPVGPLDIDRLLSPAATGGGAAFLSGDNFPDDDPDDGTHFIFNAPQDSFTSGKTVRNDADDADLTSAAKGDLFKYFATGTKWVRQYDFSSLVEAIGGLDNPIFAARAEQAFFNANTNVGSTAQDANLRTTDPISTLYPAGGSDPILISAVSDDVNAIQILKAGVYHVHLEGSGTMTGNNARRWLPRITFSTSDSFFAEVDDHYHRRTGAGTFRMSGNGILYVLSDNLVVTTQIDNEVSGGNDFNLDANWSLTFSPLGVQGSQGEQGRFELSIYQNVAADSVPTTAPTGGTFTYGTGLLTAEPTGWSQTPTTPTGTQRTIKAVATIDYANRSGATESVTWSVPIPVTGAPGAAGTGMSVLFGAYADGEIPVNRIVTFGGNIYWTTANIPSSNTDNPTQNSNFRQLDIGSGNDLVGAILVGGTTLRFSRRSGATFDISLPAGGSGSSTLSEPNIPETDPTVDGTLLFLNADVTAFTAGKTVRNEADDGDLTTGLEGDCYKWILAETNWVRQFQGAGIYEAQPLDEADTEGNLVATSATLPTAAQTTAFTGAWVITTEVSGITNNNGVLQGLPRLRPSSSVFGWSVSAYENDTKVGETFFAFGASDPDPDQTTGLSYSGKPLSFGDNDEVVMVEYYHDDTTGDSIRLVGVGKALPANATVQVRLAVSGNTSSSSGQSGQSGGQTGVIFITQNLIQITQWIRSASEPADPGTVTYDASAGTFSGLGQNGWSQTRPTAGTDPYWTATVTLARGSDGTWSSGTDWVITAATSSLIQFRNYSTNAWEAAPSDTMSMMRIWTNGVWREIPLATNNLLFETDVNDNELLTLASPVSVSDIEYLRFDVAQGNTRITARISMDMLAGVDRDQLQEHQGAMEATRSDLNRTMVFLLDRWGFGGCMVVGTQNISQRDYSQAGGAYFNFFVNSSDQITHCRVISTFGIINHLRNSVDTILRIVAETQ